MNTKNYRVYLIIVLMVIFSCNKDKDLDFKNSNDKANTLRYEIDFPSIVFTNKKYKGKITFYNSMLDTIAIPRRDTTNFRFIIYKPFKAYLDKDVFYPIYKDSILLDKNTVEIEFTFNKKGVYKIGGLARDAIRMNYYSNGIRDSARFVEHEIILFHKVIVKDSI